MSTRTRCAAELLQWGDEGAVFEVLGQGLQRLCGLGEPLWCLKVLEGQTVGPRCLWAPSCPGRC